MSDVNIIIDGANPNQKESEMLTALKKLDMTVEPYSEVKKYLDHRARETMYKLRSIANELLSFSGDEHE